MVNPMPNGAHFKPDPETAGGSGTGSVNALDSNFRFNLAATVLIVASLGLGAAYLLDAVRVPPGDGMAGTKGPDVDFFLAGTQLAIPENWIRYERQRPGGFTDAIDLTIPLQLPGQPGQARARADVKLLARGRAIPSAVLLDTLYIHRFGTLAYTDVRGLVGKSLGTEGGYRDEVVWYDPLSPNPFVAKCLRLTADGTDIDTCMRTVAVNDQVSALVRFDGAILNDWRGFDAALSGALAGLLPGTR
jgi:hypothetical protein